MASFEVQRWLQQYQQGQRHVTMSAPEQVTCWTKTGDNDPDGNRFLFGDESGLATYIRPQLPVNLNEGYPQHFTRKQEGLASPVDTIVEAATAAAVDWTHMDVVTYRNNLNKVLLTPINMEDWQLDCCYHEASATLFLDIIPGQQATFKDADKFTYYGYKFETVCTGGGSDVDATSEFGIVVTYRLGRLRLLMAAEVDAAQQGPDGSSSYVEMKTYGLPRHNKATADMYSLKHPRWWVQSYLAGVPTMVLGARDQQGNLIKVQEVPVQALPGLSAHANHSWDPGMLLAFGEAVLLWLQQQAASSPNQQLHAWHDARSSSIQCQVVDGDMPERLQRLIV